MIAFLIFLIIVLVIIFLLLSCVDFCFAYNTDLGEPLVYVRFLFLKIPIYPKKKHVKVSRYSYKKLQKRLKKQRKSKADKKSKKTIAKSQEKSIKSVYRKIKLLLFLLKRIYRTFLDSLKIKIKKICITVGSDDSAKTAYLYGGIYAALGSALTLIHDQINLIGADENNITVSADFLSDRITAELKITLSIRLFAVIAVAFKAAYNYLKLKIKK